MLAFVYAPGETAVLARDMVPVVVTGPPVNPVPVATEVTVPDPPPPPPEAADTSLPWASTVILAFV